MKGIYLFAEGDEIAVLLFILCLVLIALIWNQDERKRRRAETDKLIKDNGLLERYKPILSRLTQVAKDVRVLKHSTESAELVATLHGHKTYIMLRHSTLLRTRVNITLAVVTTTGTRKRTLTYREPANAPEMWEDVEVETEKLIDDV